MEERGLSPADVDTQTNRAITSRTLARVVAGKRSLFPEEIQAIAPVLGVSPEDLFRAIVVIGAPRPLGRWQDWRDAIEHHHDLVKVPDKAKKLAIALLELWLEPH